jgi:hypothetical protein
VKKSRNRPRSAAGKCSVTRPTRPAELKNARPAKVPTRVSDPFDAREALENSDLAAVGRYLRDDVAPLLRLIADHRHQTKREGTRPRGYDPDQEFEYETEDVRWAIDNGRSGLVDGYLHRLAPLLGRLGDMIDPNGGSEHQLKPGRRRSGKPRTKTQEEFEERVHQDLRFALIRAGGKLEAAVAEVSLKHGISRATVFRIWKSGGLSKN